MNLRMVQALVAASALLCGSLEAQQRSAPRPNLSGVWKFDSSQSTGPVTLAGMLRADSVESITIEHKGPQLKITVTNGEVLSITADNILRKTGASVFPFTVQQKAYWAGKKLVLETSRTSLGDRCEIKESFELSADRGTLTLEKSVQGGRIHYSFASSREDVDKGKPMMSAKTDDSEAKVSKAVFVKASPNATPPAKQ